VGKTEKRSVLEGLKKKRQQDAEHGTVDALRTKGGHEILKYKETGTAKKKKPKNRGEARSEKKKGGV